MEQTSLTWEKAKNTATTDSLTQQQVINMQRDSVVENVMMVSDIKDQIARNPKRFVKQGEQKRMRNWDRCGRVHGENECKARNFVCYYCSRKGNIASMCFKKRRDDNIVIIKTVRSNGFSCVIHININNIAVFLNKSTTS